MTDSLHAAQSRDALRNDLDELRRRQRILARALEYLLESHEAILAAVPGVPEVNSATRYRNQILEEWGFDSRPRHALDDRRVE